MICLGDRSLAKEYKYRKRSQSLYLIGQSGIYIYRRGKRLTKNFYYDVNTE